MNSAATVSSSELTGVCLFFSFVRPNVATRQFCFIHFETEGIMSAIDFYCDVGTTTGKNGEKRVVITFNGKFLPHIEQRMNDNTARSPRD